MSEDLGYDYCVFDRRQLEQLRAASRTEERVNLPAALDQFPLRSG
jgi:hypothetical protein